MSVADINQPVAVPERVVRVMRMIAAAASAGSRSPTNQEIADALGASSVSCGANIIALLETMGLISVTRYQGRARHYHSEQRQEHCPNDRQAALERARRGAATVAASDHIHQSRNVWNLSRSRS
jgi:SOS-response transcriptional repressor LexA